MKRRLHNYTHRRKSGRFSGRRYRRVYNTSKRKWYRRYKPLTMKGKMIKFKHRASRKLIMNKKAHRAGAAKWLDREHFVADQSVSLTSTWTTNGQGQVGALLAMDDLFYQKNRRYSFIPNDFMNDGKVFNGAGTFDTQFNGLYALCAPGANGPQTRYRYAYVTHVIYDLQVSRQDEGAEVAGLGNVDTTTTMVGMLPLNADQLGQFKRLYDGSSTAVPPDAGTGTRNDFFQRHAYLKQQPHYIEKVMTCQGSPQPVCKIRCSVPVKRYKPVGWPQASTSLWNDLTANTGPTGKAGGAFNSAMYISFFAPVLEDSTVTYVLDVKLKIKIWLTAFQPLLYGPYLPFQFGTEYTGIPAQPDGSTGATGPSLDTFGPWPSYSECACLGPSGPTLVLSP